MVPRMFLSTTRRSRVRASAPLKKTRRSSSRSATALRAPRPPESARSKRSRFSTEPPRAIPLGGPCRGGFVFWLGVTDSRPPAGLTSTPRRRAGYLKAWTDDLAYCRWGEPAFLLHSGVGAARDRRSLRGAGGFRPDRAGRGSQGKWSSGCSAFGGGGSALAGLGAGRD